VRDRLSVVADGPPRNRILGGTAQGRGCSFVGSQRQPPAHREDGDVQAQPAPAPSTYRPNCAQRRRARGCPL